jgi:7-cyano-7-deazaguanine synthase in queuosine biosynthesis
MAKDLAIVLSSGSVNSAVATALAAQRFRVILIHIEPAEAPPPGRRAAYEQQAVHFKPFREHTVPMPFLGFFQSDDRSVAAASDPRQAPLLAPQMIELLPLLSVAVRFAAHYQADAVYSGFRVGPNADDLAQATEYLQVWNELLQLPCAKPELSIEAPLLDLEPWQVVDLGFQTAAPLDRTWTCTEAGPEPCWACAACRNREAAFLQAAKPDPLKSVRKA